MTIVLLHDFIKKLGVKYCIEEGRGTAAAQCVKTQRLLRLTEALELAGIRYVVVKGALCRELYTRPDLCPSGDEDILISPEDFSRCSVVLVQDGLERMTEEDGPVTHWLDRQTGRDPNRLTRLLCWRISSKPAFTDSPA